MVWTLLPLAAANTASMHCLHATALPAQTRWRLSYSLMGMLGVLGHQTCCMSTLPLKLSAHVSLRRHAGGLQLCGAHVQRRHF
jgi:hypothetical protein